MRRERRPAILGGMATITRSKVGLLIVIGVVSSLAVRSAVINDPSVEIVLGGAKPYDAETEFVPVATQNGDVFRDDSGTIVLFRQSALMEAVDAYGAEHHLQRHSEVVKDPETGELSEVVTGPAVDLYSVLDRIGESDRKSISDAKFAGLHLGPNTGR